MRQETVKRKGGGVLRLLAVLLLLVGLGVLLFPQISQQIYNYGTRQLVREFEQSMATQSDLLEQLYQRLLEENRSLYLQGQRNLYDPFSYEQPGVDLSRYGITDNLIGYLDIPRLGEQLPIYLGANEENMKRGAVHLTETSYPIGGENTNVVLAAHRGYYRAAMFRHIEKMEDGDELTIRNFRQTLTYKVVGTEIILPDEVDKVLIQGGRDMLTLVTCHPYGQNSHRYIVYCERVS